MMESIEKLREFINDQFVSSGQAYLQGMAIAGSIEREIERDYMKLPVDAEGVPIHVGDVMKLKQCGERIGTVTAVGKHVEARAWLLQDGKNVSISYIASGIKHVKPRTIEDILADMLDAYDKGEDGDMPYSFIADYADELHELMEVGK